MEAQNYLNKYASRLLGHLFFKKSQFLRGRCNICGNNTKNFFDDESIYRESLVCNRCFTTSRYRLIARGILLAIKEIKGVEA
jgi:ribosomal protein S27E